MKKTIFLIYLILVIGIESSLYSEEKNSFTEPSSYKKNVSPESFSNIYEEGLFFFLKGDYIRAKSIFSSILEDQRSSENLKGSALWGRAWVNACLGMNTDLINDNS